MANNDDVVMDFVRRSLEHGLPKSDIKAALLEAGWTKELANNAVNSYADVEFPIPVPKLKPYLSARDAFVYLILFAALYVAAFDLVFLFFKFIELAFPLTQEVKVDRIYDAIRGHISALIVSFPVYFFLSARVSKAISIDPSKRASKIRRWLTYLTLFVTAQIVIGDLISLIYYFLGGDLTIRFALKVITIAAIAGGLFIHYYSSMRRDEEEA